MPRRLCALLLTLTAVFVGIARSDAPGDFPGKHHFVDPTTLPAPFETSSSANGPWLVDRPKGMLPDVPEGFAVNLFAEGLGGENSPRSMAFAPNGDLFVVLSGEHRVVVLRDTNQDGVADERKTFADKDDGLRLPFGIAFHPLGLYVANTNGVVRFAYRSGQLRRSGRPKAIIRNIPGFGYNQHWTRNIVFSGDYSRLYLSIGSASNNEREAAPRASIYEYHSDGSHKRRLAHGLRNPAGLAINPVTGSLWSCVNERDGLGDDLVPDYFTRVKPGGFYGWPFFYIGANPDPRVDPRPELASKVLTPDVLLESHSAPLGCLFYTGNTFPAEFRNDAFVALHGSWNRALRTGYKVVRVRFANGVPVGGYDDFLTGFMVDPTRLDVWGRPVSLVQAPDGALLVSDDGGHRIWRVRYEGAL